MSERCPNCRKGTLSATTVLENVTYKGTMLAVPDVPISVCDQCREEIVTPDQARAGQVLFADARRAFDGLLTSQDIRGIRRKLRLSQEAASAIFGGGANAFSKYERGEVTQSRAMDLLLRAAAVLPDLHAWLKGRKPVVQERAEWGAMSNMDLATAPELHGWLSLGSPAMAGEWTNATQHLPSKPRAVHGNVVSLEQRRSGRIQKEIIAADAEWGDFDLKANHG